MIDSSDIVGAVTSVTKEWAKQRKAEERSLRFRSSRKHLYSKRVYFTEIADEILPAGYARASGDGRYTVDNRQFYYACREQFRAATGREIDADYFSQTLLVRYMNQHPRETAHWKITASPRGTLTIPNTGHDLRIPCGTLAIEEHLAERGVSLDPFGDLDDIRVNVVWPSLAEGQRYRAVLYIEKEGFDPQLREADIANRFGIAIISCKGQSVKAARKYVDLVCRVNGGVPLFVVHDFDPYGFSIRQRLTSVSKWARENGLVKYEFQNDIHEIDLGLRLEDVEQYGLQYEEFEYKGVPDDIEATEAERDFWCSGRRVELNAFTAPQFIEWHEAKLTHHLGPDSFIPSDDVLADAYRRAVAVAHINRAIEATRKKAIEDAKAAPIPKSLRRKLQADIAHSPRAWDKALYDQARESLNLD